MGTIDVEAGEIALPFVEAIEVTHVLVEARVPAERWPPSFVALREKWGGKLAATVQRMASATRGHDYDLEGWKAIAAETGKSVAWAQLHAKGPNRLPIERRFGRVVARSADVRAWLLDNAA